MIPLQLTLKNFLSYREATLDFRGLHTACICGANGAGKSSLLEAITWAIWGKTRAVTEDDVIHIGATDVRVDFEFIFAQQTYRVIRTRQRGRTGDLQFQIATPEGFRALSSKGLKAAQDQIKTYIRLDYNTFINSAYLRQGKADEFMLLTPNDRKTILAKLLKLDQYEDLANHAKDIAREYKGQIEALNSNLEPIKAKIKANSDINQQIKALNDQIATLKLNLQTNQVQLDKLQKAEQKREELLNQLTSLQTRHQETQKDRDRYQTEIQSISGQLKQLEEIIAQESTITSNYEQLKSLKVQEKELSSKFSRYEHLQTQKQQLEQQIQQQRHKLELNRQQYQTRLQNLEQQEQEINTSLSEVDSVNQGLRQLRASRQRLQELDRLQQEVIPLKQRRDTLQSQIERAQASIQAQLEQLKNRQVQLSEAISYLPQKREELQNVDEQIQTLEKKRHRYERVQLKIQSRQNHEEKLKERLRNYEQQIEELKIKQDSLQNSHANCPLCEQPLDEHHLHQVFSAQVQAQQQIDEQIWSTKEEITKSSQERESLIAELNTLNNELSVYESLSKKSGQLETELETIEKQYETRQQILAEIAAKERSLADHSYLQPSAQELAQIEQQLQNLNYDEKTHSLVREEERRWRWAEIKQQEIEKAQTKKQEIEQQQPQLISKLKQIEAQILELADNSPRQQEIQKILKEINTLNYKREEHNQVIAAIEAASEWEVSYQRLLQAQQEYPQKQEYRQSISAREQELAQVQEELSLQLKNIKESLSKSEDKSQEIAKLAQQIAQEHNQLNVLNKEQGRLEQIESQLIEWKTEQKAIKTNLEQAKTKRRVYEELANAFGKKGIQSLMIENILPYLEAQSNHILARLTGNQLHVKFNTQKQRKTSSKLTETLEIIIADSQGTRPYETYSGGEAFRINFAVRLALSKLLAQRAGTSLQLLVIDEGFGTQDQEGCERLIAAINAIASDFECILTVTHMQQFKEAFQTHIEVSKTDQGSQLSLSS